MTDTIHCLHRRIRPGRLTDIPALRTWGQDREMLNDFSEVVVENGRRPGGQYQYGGLSVGLYNPPIQAHWPDIYVMEDLHGQPIIPVGRMQMWGSKPIARWHCYQLHPVPDVDSLSLHIDDPPHHAFVYPTRNLTLTKIRSGDSDGMPMGDLPGVGDLNWMFCCSLLQMEEDDYAKMRGGADPPPDKPMDDPECEVLVTILRHFILLTDWADFAFIAGTIVTWFERHPSVNFYSIPSDLPTFRPN